MSKPNSREDRGGTTEYRPQARSSELVFSSLDDEVLVYDLRDHVSHCLNASAAAIQAACDGQRTVPQIAEHLTFDNDVVLLGLQDLARASLLEGEMPASLVPSGLTRRQVVKRIGFGAAVTLPMIAGFLTPAAAQVSCSGFVVPSLTCVPNNNTNLSDDGCPCVSNNECLGVCPVSSGPRFCLGGNTGPFCAPGNTLDLSIDCCPCTSNNECIGVCPVTPINGTRRCLS